MSNKFVKTIKIDRGSDLNRRRLRGEMVDVTFKVSTGRFVFVILILN